MDDNAYRWTLGNVILHGRTEGTVSCKYYKKLDIGKPIFVIVNQSGLPDRIRFTKRTLGWY